MKEEMKQYKPAEKLELKELKKELPKVFKKIDCPSCKKEVTADNLNLQTNLAKCGNCNVIFSIEEEVKIVKSKQQVKQEILRPEGIDMFYYKDELDITIQQHIHGLDAFGVIFLPPLALFSIFFYFKEGSPIFYPILFTIAALYFIYRAINFSKKNKTFIEINEKFLKIKSRPKNFKKDKTFPVDEIDQVYLKITSDGYYSVNMITNGLEGQKHQKLLTVNTLSKAKYLEQEIEWYLNIENRPVPDATA